MKKRGQETMNGMYLVLMIGLFLLIYVVLLPEGEKERLFGDGTQQPFPPTKGGSYGPLEKQVLLSESPGSVQPYGQKIFARPLASASLYAEQRKDEEVLSRSVDLESGMFSGATKDFVFKLPSDPPVDQVKLFLFLQQARGSVTISLNGQEIFSGPLTTQHLPLSLPASALRATNKLTFSVGASGIFSKNHYVLRDVTLLQTATVSHTKELRTFVLTQEDIQRFGHLSLFYIVNCFTVNQRGTLWITLNGKMISQQQIVCDAGEVSHDLQRSDLREGKNTLEFTIDKGNYVLERMLLEGDVQAGSAPSYSFSLPRNVFSALDAGGQVFLEMHFGKDALRKVATVLVNGYPLIIDTTSDRAGLDLTPYVVPGQNTLRLIAETPLTVASLDVSLI